MCAQGAAFSDLQPIFTNGGPILIHSFDLGIGDVSLQASDAIAAGSVAYATFSVITPSQAVNSLIESLQTANLSEYRYRLLADHLQQAASDFGQGSMLQGCRELDLFIMQAKALRINNWVYGTVLDSAVRLRNAFR